MSLNSKVFITGGRGWGPNLASRDVNAALVSHHYSYHKWKIWHVYLIQSVLQALLAFAFFVTDIYHYTTDWPEKNPCRITEHIPVPHDYFICSHSLVPAFAGGLIFYLTVLVISFVLFIFMIGWTVRIVMKKCKFNAPTICVEEDGDSGFLLHLLHNSNKIHVVHFATYLTKIEAYLLANEFPVSKLREN